MTIVTKLDLKKYTKLMLILSYNKPSILLITMTGFVSILLSILIFLEINIPIEIRPLTLIIYGLSVSITPLFAIKYSIKKSFNSSRLKETITYEFTGEKIILTGESFKSEMNWSKVYKIKEMNDWFLIYQSNVTINIIPKESFGDKLIDFRAMIKKIEGLKYNLKNN